MIPTTTAHIALLTNCLESISYHTPTMVLLIAWPWMEIHKHMTFRRKVISSNQGAPTYVHVPGFNLLKIFLSHVAKSSFTNNKDLKPNSKRIGQKFYVIVPQNFQL